MEVTQGGAWFPSELTDLTQDSARCVPRPWLHSQPNCTTANGVAANDPGGLILTSIFGLVA